MNFTADDIDKIRLAAQLLQFSGLTHLPNQLNELADRIEHESSHPT